MEWVDPKYSKSRVRRAGETLVDPASSVEDIDVSMSVLSNWRASHAYPMHSMLIFLRGKSAKIDDQQKPKQHQTAFLFSLAVRVLGSLSRPFQYN